MLNTLSQKVVAGVVAGMLLVGSAHAQTKDYLKQADDYFKQGMLAKAETSYYRAKMQNPNQRSVYLSLATIQRINEDHERGLKVIKEGLEIFAGDSELLIEKARFEHALGDENAMHQSLRSAYENSSSNVRIIESIAGFYRSINNPIKAEEYSDIRQRLLGGK